MSRGIGQQRDLVRHEAGVQDFDQRRGVLSRDDDLARARQQPFACHQHLGNRYRHVRQARPESLECPLGGLAEIFAIRNGGKPQQVQDGDGVSRGLGAVIVFLDAKDQRGIAFRGAEETTGFGSSKRRAFSVRRSEARWRSNWAS